MRVVSIINKTCHHKVYIKAILFLVPAKKLKNYLLAVVLRAKHHCKKLLQIESKLLD